MVASFLLQRIQLDAPSVLYCSPLHHLRRRVHRPLSRAAAAPLPPPGLWPKTPRETSPQAYPLTAASPPERLRERLQAGVLAEREEQQQQLNFMYSKFPLSKLVAAGKVLVGLTCRPEGRCYGDLVLRFERRDKAVLPPHKFSAGDSVAVRIEGTSEAGGGTSCIDATVLTVFRDHLHITLQPQAADLLLNQVPGTMMRIDVGLNYATTRRQLAALDHVGVVGELNRRGARLVRAIILESKDAKSLAADPPEWVCQSSWTGSARVQLQQQTDLNDSQRAAVAAALVRTWTLWQGPPGTGKTRTLLAFLQLLCQVSSTPAHHKQLGCLLAVADTNAAADNLLEGLLRRGIAAVRCGQAAKVRPALRHSCLDVMAEHTEAGKKAAWLRDRAAQDVARAAQAYGDGKISSNEWRSSRRESNALLAQADALLAGAVDAVLADCQVVVSTCTAAGEPRLQGRQFRVLVIDEATQATEPSTLIPLIKGAECVVMAGDHQQLPPTVVSRQALEHGLAVPLFARLQEAGMPSLLLDTQYRMHPAISHWISGQFYNGRLKSGVAAVARPPLAGISWRNHDCPVAFVGCEGHEERVQGRNDASGSSSIGGDGGASYRNHVQALAALRILDDVLQEASCESCAILSPYNGQARLLMSLVGDSALLESGRVVISSVDGFQGQEADAIIFTTVRSNLKGKLGFVSDARRMNVALSRAKRGLVVLGSAQTLRSDSNWSAWLEWVAVHGGVCD